MWVEIAEVKVAFWIALSAFSKLAWTSLANKDLVTEPAVKVSCFPSNSVSTALTLLTKPSQPVTLIFSLTAAPSFFKVKEPSVPATKVYSGTAISAGSPYWTFVTLPSTNSKPVINLPDWTAASESKAAIKPAAVPAFSLPSKALVKPVISVVL